MPFCLHLIRVLPRLSDCISHLYFLTVCFLLMQSLRCWSSGEQEPQSFRKEAATAALDIHAVGVIPTIKNRDKEWTNAQWINRKDQYCWDNHPLDFQSFTLPRPNCTELKNAAQIIFLGTAHEHLSPLPLVDVKCHGWVTGQTEPATLRGEFAREGVIGKENSGCHFLGPQEHKK